MRSTYQSGALGGIFSISGFYLLASVFGAMVPGLQSSFLIRLLAVPGDFLFTTFSLMAFFLPAYLIFNGIMVATQRDTRMSLYCSSLLSLPALSLAAVFRLLLDPGFSETLIGGFLVTNFSLAGAATIAATLSLIALILVLRLGLSLYDAAEVAEAVEESIPDHEESVSDSGPQILLPDRTLPEEQHIPGSGVESLFSAKMSEFTPLHQDDGDDELKADPVSVNESSNWRHESDMEIDMGFSRQTAEPDLPSFEEELEELEGEDEIIYLNLLRQNQNVHTENPEIQTPRAGVDLDIDDFVPANYAPEPVSDAPPEEIPPRDSEIEEDDETLIDDDDDLPVNEDLLPHPEESDELNFSRKDGPYEIPVEGVLRAQSMEAYWIIDEETTKQSEILKSTLQEFGIEAEVTGIRKGPVITMFEILPAPGVKLSRIVNLAENIALALAAASVRIVAPIPGKHAVGIEVPNKHRHLVTFSEILGEKDFLQGDHGIPVALGKDITGEAQIVDLTKTPHLLIAGATGAGKSVCVNSIITSVLYSRDPDDVNMILIDPKIVELKFYNDIPHLLTPVITDPKKAFQALQWCLFEMERRYSLLDAMAVRDIKSYNRKIVEKKIATVKLPYIVVVVDEFADLMATSGKELESTLARLAAMSRAVGIHLVLATQRPSTDVITGLIKANIPSRIAFMVSSKVDSRIIIDAVGAEKLLGKGDMLFTSSWDPFPKRIQGAFLSEAEVEEVVKHVKEMGSPDYIDDEIFIEDDDHSISTGDLDDPLMQKAIDIVCTANKASASYLQRRLSIGYNRAARLVEEMEEMGIVGPANGSKPREILRNKDIM